MLSEEAKCGDDKIEAITIAVPNGLHYAVCKAVLEAGLHAVCEKPLCFTTEQAEELMKLADAKGLVVGVTYGTAACRAQNPSPKYAHEICKTSACKTSLSVK